MHKTGNVLNKMPKSIQPKAKSMLYAIWMADTKADAEKAFDLFIATFRGKYLGAVECIEKDRNVLLAFYDFPAEHWEHIRTVNPIESTFATVRLRQRVTKGAGSRSKALLMAYKLLDMASERWRRVNAPGLVARLLRGEKFIDGLTEEARNAA